MTAHIFIDAENVKPDFGFMTVEKFRREYKINRVDIIGKEDSISQRYKTAGEPYRVQNCYFGKNSADTWLCVEIARAVYEESEVETIIIVSSDRDFLPAIKLAAEKNKNVIVISNGFGHKNLRKLLREIQVDLENIQLIDYRDGLNISDTKRNRKKKSLSELMKDATPTFIDPRSHKLRKFYSRLSLANENFLRKRENQIKFIFVKHGDTLSEFPFVDGINITVFANILHDLSISSKKSNVEKIIDNSLLKLEGNKVYLLSAEEILSEEEITVDAKIFEDFEEPTKMSQTIFISYGGEFVEIPFENGMDSKNFMETLKDYGIVGNGEFIQRILRDSLLKIHRGKVFVLLDDEEEEEDFNFENLSVASRKFLSANSASIQFVRIFQNSILYNVPFVNGMNLSQFAQIIEELGITAKNSSRNVITGNGFKIIHGIVYL